MTSHDAGHASDAADPEPECGPTDLPSPGECTCGYEQLPYPECYVCALCEMCPPIAPLDNPDAYETASVTWSMIGGVAAMGPTTVVSGDGTLEIWRTYPPEGAADERYDVGVEATNELFSMFEMTDFGSLPHGGGGAECGVSLEIEWCTDCNRNPTQLFYEMSSQVLPELECIRDWFLRYAEWQLACWED